VFLPLSYLNLVSADATVVILPSDHFIFPASWFLHLLSYGTTALENQQGQLILFGVRPNTPETECGWIQPGALMRKDGLAPLSQVQFFIEKPNALRAESLMNAGGLWNPMILVGKVKAFLNLGWLVLHDLMKKFRAFQVVIGSQWEHSMLEHIYLDMPVCNLSEGFLQKIPEYLTVLELSNVLWSDWGQPWRIVETLEVIGRTPKFLSE